MMILFYSIMQVQVQVRTIIIFLIIAIASIDPNNNYYCNALSIQKSTNNAGNNVPQTGVRELSITEKIRQAMVLSNEGQMNISSAFTAKSLWEDILSKNTKKDKKNEKYPDANVNENEDVNVDDEKNDAMMSLPAAVKKICYALYAATLVRIGRDDDALIVYEETLDLLEDDGIDLDWSLWIDTKTARGEALQRLMQYEEARVEFTQVWALGNSNGDNDSHKIKVKFKGENNIGKEHQYKLSLCAYKAALCSLRLDDVISAEDILSKEYKYNQMDIIKMKGTTSTSNQNSNIIGMLGIIQIELSKRRNEEISKSSIELLKYAALSEDASPVYKWFYYALNTNINKDNKENEKDGLILSLFKYQNDNDMITLEQLLKISSINQSPFDDPSLIHLDDKVLLHQLLTKKSNSSSSSSSSNEINNNNHFWPTGFILPHDKNKLENYCNSDDDGDDGDDDDDVKWIIKKRAGYGSHGNQIVSTNEAIEISLNLSSPSHQELLCQKVIQPTLCYQGRRFSLRVYVIYFSSGTSNNQHVESQGLASPSVFLSTIGLMKLALVESNNDSNSMEDNTQNQNDIYMTNSGRVVEGERETQYDFIFLKKYMDETFGLGTYASFWKLIQGSVSSVMSDYCNIIVNTANGTGRIKSTTSASVFGSVPKIMGFDYIIDSSLKPWLMEVNRFPGLEARGSNDSQVKTDLIQSVWELAAEQHRTSSRSDKSGCDDCHNVNVGHTFERVSIGIK